MIDFFYGNLCLSDWLDESFVKIVVNGCIGAIIVVKKSSASKLHIDLIKKILRDAGTQHRWKTAPFWKSDAREGNFLLNVSGSTHHLHDQENMSGWHRVNEDSGQA